MSNPSNPIAHRVRNLLILGIVVSFLAACGGPAPTPQVVVVTSTFTPEPAVQVVTATFTVTPEPSDTLPPTETPIPEPTATATPETPQVAFASYQHPSGAFSLDVPQDAEYSDDETGLYLTYGDTLLMVFFTIPDTPLAAADLEDAVTAVLDDALIGEDLISSYHDLEVQGNDTGDMVGARYGITSDLFGDGDGTMMLWQYERMLYFMIMLTPDYESVRPIWQTAFDSLTVNSIEPTATLAPPTNTPPLPTATPKPKPKPTKAPQPTSPSANQGCYLFENYLDAELTVTFTAQDRQWSDAFKIAASGTKEYCLNPGRYTYTIDAPPPWNSINGDIEVQAGDRYRWPIRGE